MKKKRKYMINKKYIIDKKLKNYCLFIRREKNFW